MSSSTYPDTLSKVPLQRSTNTYERSRTLTLALTLFVGDTLPDIYSLVRVPTLTLTLPQE